MIGGRSWTKSNLSQPPCEAVSWNVNGNSGLLYAVSQPPFEAVSWNFFCCVSLYGLCVSLLVRLWVEIRYVRNGGQKVMVSLLVRLWVEMSAHTLMTDRWLSASLWGCELKYYSTGTPKAKNESASLWDCELKGRLRWWKRVRWWSHPIWEDESWNVTTVSMKKQELSASLWGCELKRRIWCYSCCGEKINNHFT